MRREEGVITAVEENRIEVSCLPQSGCGNCAAKGSCSITDGAKVRKIWIPWAGKGNIGDTVEFEMEERGVVVASVIMYLFPVVTLVAGMILGNRHASSVEMDGDALMALTGFGAMALSLIIIRLSSPLLKRWNAVIPRVHRVLSSTD